MAHAKIKQELQDLLTELFKLLEVKVDIKISEDQDLYEVELDPGESAGLLIGSRGATLSAIQSFVAIAIKQKTGEWIKISLDIAGWSDKQNARLTELAQSASERVKQTGEEQRLNNINATQRRVIHMALSQDKEIETVSEGEGQDRYLIVRAK